MEDNNHNDNLDNTDAERENSRSNSVVDVSIASNVKFNNGPLEEEKLENPRKRQRISEVDLEKQLVEEEYNRKVHEQRYKRLMHLLNKSQFYSSYLVDKIGKSIEKEKTTDKKNETNKENETNKKNEVAVNDENKPPAKKRPRKKIVEKYKMQEYISKDIRNKIQNKRNGKLNLSTEEIEAELSMDSDTETKASTSTTTATSPTTVSKYFQGDLRDYQQVGLQWLRVLYENGLNGILADEMGLGKTIQVIALFCHLIEKRQTGPYLIVAPLSTIPNWMLEFERFAPDIPVVIFHGSQDERAALYSRIQYKHYIETDGRRTEPVVITSYDVPLREAKFLQNEKWRYIVIDEGHRIKNYNCLLVKILKKCQSMNRLLLTGTPLQNNLSELWSLLNFLLPDIFDDLAVFESWFNLEELQHQEGAEKLLKQEEEKHVLSSLREILKPFMLRRVKTEVCLEIPPKKELVVYAPLTELQHDLYRAVLNRDIQTLSKIEDQDLIISTENGRRPKRRCVLKSKYGSFRNNFENVITEPDISFEESEISNDGKDQWKAVKPIDQNDKELSLWKQYTDVTERNRDFLVRIQFRNRLAMYKKIVNHPYLVHCPLDSYGLPKIDDDLIRSSGKLLVLDAMLAKLKAQGHKVLLFSTMTLILDMIEDYLSLRDYKYVRLDGQTKIEIRKTNIDDFNNNKNIFLFLISTRAGGIGLNLASADTVIIYDSDWNPQVDIQAMARCHRIGQTRPVVVYRLCTKATIDEAIIKRSEAKRVLEKIVISKDWHLKTFNKDTMLKLKQLLESKEYKVVTSEKEVFTEAELNKLLDRSDMLNNHAVDDPRE